MQLHYGSGLLKNSRKKLEIFLYPFNKHGWVDEHFTIVFQTCRPLNTGERMLGSFLGCPDLLGHRSSRLSGTT